MFNFKKKEINKQRSKFSYIAALLIHAAKIDENFTDKEEKIIKNSLLELGVETEKIASLMEVSKEIEKESNHIIDFTKEVKKMKEEEKKNYN